jgi:hypothetical protein
MLALRELQAEFKRALLGAGDMPAGLRAAFANDPFTDERFAVYRNNVLASLTASLRETFPVVCRLVDERFFAYAAHEFVCAHPPTRPALSEYGAKFPDFLASFPPCRDLVYLPDVGRLEWLLNTAATALELTPVSVDALSGIAEQDAPSLQFRLASLYLESPYPVDAIWRANQPDAGAETIDLAAGTARLEISRRNGAVAFRPLDPASFAFRKSLANGAILGGALKQALVTGNFAPGEALAQLFHDGVVTGVRRRGEEEKSP